VVNELRTDHTLSAPPALLEIEDLHTDVTRGSTTSHAVRGVSLQVSAGQAIGIVGESGCGKTMSALSVMRLLPPGGRIVSGSIRVAGEELVGAEPKRMWDIRGNDIGMIFQDPMTSLNPTMTVGAQIAETVVRHRGLGSRAARDRAIEVLNLVGMPSPAQRFSSYPHQLSGGQRQRVMIAMAIACEPRLLIADEPTTALDVTIQGQILDLLDDLRQRLSMSLVLVTHDLGVVAGRVDRVVAMYAGKVAEQASTRTLFNSPRHPYMAALLEAMPERAVRDGGRLQSIPGMPPDLGEDLHGCAFAPRCRFADEQCRTRVPGLTLLPSGDGFECFHPHLDQTPPVEPERPLADRPGRSDGFALRLHEVVKDFDVTTGGVSRRVVGTVSAVAGVSFSVTRGETFGLVGESGCGKTTLGRMVVALERPTSGSIEVAGQNLFDLRGSGLRTRRRDAQMVFQDSYAALDPRMPVSAILSEPFAIQRTRDRREVDRRVRGLLDAVGLPTQALHKYPHEFSGGQRQRIGLARALALEPAVIVADEPVSALDVSVQAQILNLMDQLRRELSLTYLFISHDLAVVRYLADRVAVMYLGKIVEIGPSADVYGRPQHPYTRALVDAAPSIDAAFTAEAPRASLAGEPVSALDPPSGCRFRVRCPRAQSICAEVEPMLESRGDPAHSSACHFPLTQDSPKEAP
jgi:peptide/nickel transport system ATP-binding protein